LSYILAADSMGLTSFKFFSNRVRIRWSSSSKVDDFGTNQTRICDFLLVRHTNLGHILHRFWDAGGLIGWKLRIFPTLSHWRHIS